MGSNIERALLNGIDVETAVNQEVLLFAVQRTIMCPHSGRCLDIRRAVLITVKDGPGEDAKTIHMECVDGDWYDQVAETLAKATGERNWPMEIIDGRVINAPNRRAKLKHER